MRTIRMASASVAVMDPAHVERLFDEALSRLTRYPDTITRKLSMQYGKMGRGCVTQWAQVRRRMDHEDCPGLWAFWEPEATEGGDDVLTLVHEDDGRAALGMLSMPTFRVLGNIPALTVWSERADAA